MSDHVRNQILQQAAALLDTPGHTYGSVHVCRPKPVSAVPSLFIFLPSDREAGLPHERYGNAETVLMSALLVVTVLAANEVDANQMCAEVEELLLDDDLEFDWNIDRAAPEFTSTISSNTSGEVCFGEMQFRCTYARSLGNPYNFVS